RMRRCATKSKREALRSTRERRSALLEHARRCEELADSASYVKSKHSERTQRLRKGWLAWVESWRGAGFPQVVVEPKLFAAMAATRIPQEMIPNLGMPWDCWVLRVPPEVSQPM